MTHGRCCPWVFAAGLILATAPLVYGQLTWDNPEQLAKVGVGTATTEAVFPFTNTGNYPLTIITVRGERGVTAIRPSKRTYRPGERGEIRVQMQIGQQEGELTRTITVRTDDARQSQAELLLHVDVPRRVTIEPAMVRWEVGQDEVVFQTVKITPHPELELEVTGVKLHDRLSRMIVRRNQPDQAPPALDELIEHELARDEATGAYLLKLKPLDVSKPTRVPLVLELKGLVSAGREYLVWVLVASTTKLPDQSPTGDADTADKPETE